MWLLYYDPILEIPLPRGCTLYGFADDVGMVVSANILEGLKTAIAAATDSLTQWLGDHGLRMALDKTEIAFLNGRRVPEGFTFNVGNTHRP